MPESFRYLASVIGAHEKRTVNGRTRLQKTIKLLQRLGFPTDYDYRLFFYGPYSEAVWFDLRLLEQSGHAKEEEVAATPGSRSPWYKISVGDTLTDDGLIERWRPAIRMMEQADLVSLELAATYDSFREMGSDHDTAMLRLKRKKGAKCTEPKISAALSLLKNLELPVN